MILDFLRSVIARIIDAPGCRSCELLVQRDDPTRLAMIEVWDSVEAHQASASRILPGASIYVLEATCAEIVCC